MMLAMGSPVSKTSTPDPAAVARQPHSCMDHAIKGTTKPPMASPRLMMDRARARNFSNHCTSATDNALGSGGFVDVRIPAGVADGQVLRLKGQGMPGSKGAPPGDAYVEIHVDPHAFTKPSCEAARRARCGRN